MVSLLMYVPGGISLAPLEVKLLDWHKQKNFPIKKVTHIPMVDSC